MSEINPILPKGGGSILKFIQSESVRTGIRLHGVGGCVRDWALGIATKDLDFVSEQDPLPVARACVKKWGGRLERFDRFMTLRVFVGAGFRLDFARARKEVYPAPAALPVVSSGTLEEDLIRRDFTVNAMAAPLLARGWGRIIDPFGGLRDLRAKVLRVLHPLSFQDDPTRLHRAARFACRFSFRMEAKTGMLRREAVRGGVDRFLSRERLRGELLRILEEREAVRALKKLKSWGLMEAFHPRLKWPADLENGRNAYERLGMMAVQMGGHEAVEFLSSLHLERSVSQALIEAERLAHHRMSPRTAMAPLTRDVLRLSVADAPNSAFDPLLLGGNDLEALGLKPGPSFKTLLDVAAKAQWAGEFSSRPQALRWLESKTRV